MLNRLLHKLNRLLHKLTFKKELLQEDNSFDPYYESPKITPNHFNKEILSNENANGWLKTAIKQGKPFFATRFGTLELSMASNYLYNQLVNKEYWSQYSLNMLTINPAWGGSVKKQERFYDSYLRSIAKIDGLGVWYNPGEHIMANYICQDATLFELRAFEPFFYEKPWTLALEGKKILVIHPYTYSIPRQYAQREKLFSQPVLPEFHLQCYRPFSTYTDEWKQFEDMQDALQKMIDDIEKLDFDVALIACGPQGLPLGAAIKRMNKQAIHVGGSLQLFFGIIGKRWEEPGRAQSKFFNEYWVRPSPSETPNPQVFKYADGGCYW